MFETIINFFKKLKKHETKETNSKEQAKERLHLVLMQDRANVSADFLEMMKQEIIEVIKKYIEVEENSIDVRLTNEIKEDGTTGAPSLYANIPILNIRSEMKKEVSSKEKEKEVEKEEAVKEKEEIKEKQQEIEKEENNAVSKENTPDNNVENNKTDEKVDQNIITEEQIEDSASKTEEVHNEENKEKKEEDKKED